MKRRDLGIAPVKLGRRGRLVCTVCRKASFATEDDARRAAEAASGDLYWYLGKRCRWWHLTRQPQDGQP